jgi:hypothetical protein
MRVSDISFESLFLELSAERAGFEPAIQFPVYTLSRRAPSTTRTPLLGMRCDITKDFGNCGR